jgi:hypothetical protein
LDRFRKRIQQIAAHNEYNGQYNAINVRYVKKKQAQFFNNNKKQYETCHLIVTLVSALILLAII